MDWFSPFGLCFMLVILIPNVIFALKQKGGFENKFSNKALELFENIGRYGCFIFMVFNLPFTWFGFSSDEAFAVYLIANIILTLAYILIWIFCFRRNSLFRAVSLSVIPSLIFLLSGILSRSVLLIISAVIFAPCHIIISVKNVKE